jgi:hypothetical protein
MRRARAFRFAAGAIAAAIGLASSAARADEDGTAGLLAGATSSLLPLVVGAYRASMATTYPARNGGLLFAGAGLTAAPIFAHVAEREYARGLVFSLPAVAAEIGTIALFSTRPDAVFSATVGTRTVFGALFTLQVFTAAIGTIDATYAPDRAARKSRSTLSKSVSPYLVPVVGGAAFGVGGTL